MAGIASRVAHWCRRTLGLPRRLLARLRVPRGPAPLGLRGERAAAKYLKRQGYKIVARSQQAWGGEIDLVAVDGQTVVFVEVKTRQSQQAGQPFEAVDADKQRRLTRLALGWLRHHGLLEYPARFDIVSITWAQAGKPSIEHLRSAFEATGLKGLFS